MKDRPPVGVELLGEWERVSAAGACVGRPTRAPVYVTFTADGRFVRRLGDDPPDRGRTWKADPTASPSALDVQYVGPAEVPLRLAIYKVEGVTLTICGQSVGRRDRPTEFAAPAGSGFGLEVSKRVRPKD